MMHPIHANLMRYFEYRHLPDHLQERSKRFHDLAEVIATDTTRSDGSEVDGPEVTHALRKLLEAKDCAVRAHVAA